MGMGPEEGVGAQIGVGGGTSPYLLGITGGPWLSLTSTSSSQVVVPGPWLCMLGSRPSPLHGSLQVLEDDSLVVPEYLLDTAGLGPGPAQSRLKKCQQHW